MSDAAPAPRRGETLERVTIGLVLLVLFLVPGQRWARVKVLDITIQVSDFILVAAISLFAVLVVTGRFRLRRTGIEWPLVLYPAASFLSLINAPAPGRALIKTAGILSLVVTTYLVIQLFRAPRRRHLVVDVWLLGTAVVTSLTFVGLVGFFAVGPDFAATRWTAFSLGSLPDSGLPRVSGPFVIGNMYCNYLVFSAALLFGAWRRLQSRFGVLPLLALAGLIAVSTLFTLSTGWGGFALGLIVILYAREPRNWPWLRTLRPLLAVLAVGVTAFLVFITIITIVPKGWGEPLLGPLGDLRWEPSGRVLGWRSALDTIAAHPLLGSGAGEFVSSFWHEWAMQGSDGGPVWRFYVLEAHNVWLGVWGQLGVIGLGALIWLVASLMRGAARAADPRWRTALLAGFVGGLLFHGLFASIEDARYLWVFFAWAALVGNPAGSELGAAQDQVGQQPHEGELNGD